VVKSFLGFGREEPRPARQNIQGKAVHTGRESDIVPREEGHHDHDHVFHALASRMAVAFFLTMTILVIEAAGGLVAHSLALLSDAGHVLTDIVAIALSWFALRQAEKPADVNMTFGYYRSGVLAALVNGVSLILIMLWILWEAYGRLRNPTPVQGIWMFVSAGAGLLINLYLGFTMHDDENINVKSAVLHMFGDAAASAAVIVGGVVIQLTKWYVIDPVLSVFIALLIAVGAWRIVKQSIVILMEGVPAGVDFQTIINELMSIDGIFGVHDLHIWSITSGRNALSCHVVCKGNMTIEQSQLLLSDVEQRLLHLKIHHVTIQVENEQHRHSDSPFCPCQRYPC